jgi:hypothetical protein
MNVAKIPQIQALTAAEVARDLTVSNMERMCVLRAIDLAPSANLAQRRIADRLHDSFRGGWDWISVLANGVESEELRENFTVRLSREEISQLRDHLRWALEKAGLPNGTGRPITAVYDRLSKLLEPPKEADNGP